MDRLSRIDPGRGLAMRRAPAGRRREGPLPRTTRLGSSRPLVQLYWGALTVGAAFGAMLAEATPAAQQLGPFDWYPVPGETQGTRLPSIVGLPAIPLPGPDDTRDGLLQALPLGPIQRLRRGDEPDDRLGALAFDPDSLGELQSLARGVSGPVAHFDPAPLGPARPFELPIPGALRATADLALAPAPLGPTRAVERPVPTAPPPRPDPAFGRAPLGPPQRLQLAQAYPRSQFGPDPLGPPQALRPPRSSLSEVLAPTLLGPPQRLQLAQAHSRAPFRADPMGPPQALRPPPSSIAEVLAPTLLGPPQRLWPGWDGIPPSRSAASAPGAAPSPAPARGEVGQAMAPTPRETPTVTGSRRRTRDTAATAPVTTGSLRTTPTVSMRDGMVVIRVRY
jgi:hypothetical protein